LKGENIMTKSTMINTIQERELELYESLRLANIVFGEDSNEAKRRRAAWNSVWMLMNDMGIEPLERSVKDD
jgi:hypothetical protein